MSDLSDTASYRSYSAGSW